MYSSKIIVYQVSLSCRFRCYGEQRGLLGLINVYFSPTNYNNIQTYIHIYTDTYATRDYELPVLCNTRLLHDVHKRSRLAAADTILPETVYRELLHIVRYIYPNIDEQSFVTTDIRTCFYMFMLHSNEFFDISFML